MRGIIQNDPHSLAPTGNHNKSFALNEASPYVLARILDSGDRPTTPVDGAHKLIEIDRYIEFRTSVARQRQSEIHDDAMT
jgi:hypothetical protein